MQGSLDEKLSSEDLSLDMEGAASCLDAQKVKENSNNVERGNASDISVPCTEDHIDGNVDLGNTLNVESRLPPMKSTAAEEEIIEKMDYLEKEEIHDNTTIPFIVDLTDTHTGLESSVNVDKSHLEPTPNSMQSTATEDKDIFEISLTPLKRSTPRTSLVPFPQNYPCENDKSFNLSHHSPKDNNNIKLSQQRCSVSLNKDKISLQDTLPMLAEHGPDVEQNSIVLSQDHHKKHSALEGNVSTELCRTCKKHIVASDIMSETDNTPRNCASTLIKKSVSIQVDPRKLGILTTKWIQVKGPRLAEVGVQADPVPSPETELAENLDTQIPVSECPAFLPKVFVDKEMQTIIQIKRDKSSQTGEVNLKEENRLSQPLWHMISLSGLPKRKEYSAPGKKYKMSIAGDDNEKKNTIDNVTESSNEEKSITKEKKLFHGRPLVKGKITKPIEIPLDAVVSLLDPAFQDPRLVSN